MTGNMAEGCQPKASVTMGMPEHSHESQNARHDPAPLEHSSASPTTTMTAAASPTIRAMMIEMTRVFYACRAVAAWTGCRLHPLPPPLHPCHAPPPTPTAPRSAPFPLHHLPSHVQGPDLPHPPTHPDPTHPDTSRSEALSGGSPVPEHIASLSSTQRPGCWVGWCQWQGCTSGKPCRWYLCTKGGLRVSVVDSVAPVYQQTRDTVPEVSFEYKATHNIALEVPMERKQTHNSVPKVPRGVRTYMEHSLWGASGVETSPPPFPLLLAVCGCLRRWTFLCFWVQFWASRGVGGCMGPDLHSNGPAIKTRSDALMKV